VRLSWLVAGGWWLVNGGLWLVAGGGWLLNCSALAAQSPTPATPNAAPTQSSPTARFRTAWREHQDKIDSATFRWTEYQAHRRDWLPNPRHLEPDHLRDPQLAVERMDSVLRVVNIVRNRLQFSYTVRRSTPDGRRRQPATRISQASDRHPEAQHLWLRPVLLNVRGLERHLGQQGLGRAVPVRVDSIWRGQPLTVIEEPFDTSGWKYALWLEPGRDYVVRRLVLIRQLFDMIQMDIEYLKDPDVGWVPCRWVINRRKTAGALWRSDTSVLTAYSINGTERTVPAPIPGERDRRCR
jgi:hypothetical protein